MKKIGIILLAMMLLVLLVGCDRTNGTCEHAFGEWTQTQAPTCTAEGEEARVCSKCGETETRTVETVAHETEHHEGKAASCTEDGFAAYDTCKNCDYTTYRVIEKLGHDIQTHERIEPTYTKEGYEPYEYCTRCDWEGEKTPIDPKGLQYQAVTFDLFALPRYIADGATLKARLIYADDPDQVVDLQLVEFTLLTGNLPMGAEKVQLLRYDHSGTTLWEQTSEYPIDDEVTAYMLKADDNGFGIYPYEEQNFLYINFTADGKIVTGGDRFGIYFYKKDGSAEAWVQAVLDANYCTRVSVPEGMNAFKLLRTSLTDAPLSWSCDYWGGTEEISLGDDNYYVLTDWNSGNFLGAWGNWKETVDVTVTCNDTTNAHVTADKELTGLLSGSKLTLTVTADAGYYVKEVTVDGKKVELSGDTLTVYVTKAMTIDITVEAGADTAVTVTVDLTAVCQGNEIFGVYFYNTVSGENEWKKATVVDKKATLKVAEKYNAFKILRTDPATTELSWSSPWWGQSADIVLEEGKTLYIVNVGDGSGHWGGAWQEPLPTAVTIDFSGVTLPETVGKIAVFFMNTSTFESQWVAADFDGAIATVAVPEGMTAFHVFCLAQDAELSEEAYTGLGQTGDIALIGGADRYVIGTPTDDVFSGDWSTASDS